jgi:tRNA pseudouridine55 synthase
MNTHAHQNGTTAPDGEPKLSGLLIVDKPRGCSSMDVVRVVRRAAGKVKTGHAGTLDPLASGVVICCLGRATRAVEHLMGLAKVYQTTIDLSAFSTTDDLEGVVEPVDITAIPSESQVRASLDQLIGDIEQVPPAYSAVLIRGRRAYKLARQGQSFTMPPRIVRIDRIDLDRYDWPQLDLTITCGRGTYIRSMARQIAELLNTAGHLTALRRTAIGPYTVDSATHLDHIPQPITADHLLPAPPRW